MERAKSLPNFEANDASVSPKDPSPSQLEEFLPWAAEKLGIDEKVCVTKIAQVTLPPLKGKKSEAIDSAHLHLPASFSAYKHEGSKAETGDESRNLINIETIYYGEDLTHIQFKNTKHIPNKIIAIIGLVLEFHPVLHKITIDSGIDAYTSYELSKILSMCNVTEICLDNCFVKEGNYAILLNEPNCLQVLSLARCRLGDEVTKDIASKLHHPLPACKKLCSLNLSSNSITDTGAKYLAAALRTNRKLSHLNIADNRITDEGGEAILNVLLQFPLTKMELLEYRQRYMNTLKKVQKLQQLTEYVSLDAKFKGKYAKGKKAEKPTETTNDRVNDDNKFSFEDPMSDCCFVDGWKYSNGNNTLGYLNVAYNRLSCLFLKRLIKVFEYQQPLKPKLQGLENIMLEGNPLPEACPEYNLLDSYIDWGFSFVKKKVSHTSIKKVMLK